LRTEKYTDLAADYGWPILHGTARFDATDDGPVLWVDVDGGGQRRVHAAHYLLATGSTRGQRLLLAAGRRPVTAGLNLDGVGVKTGNRGEVVVDEELRTTQPRIWAAGDVTGHPQYVYVAAAHGALVAANALDGAQRTLDYTQLPAVTFTTPALASAGLTDTARPRPGSPASAGYCRCRRCPARWSTETPAARSSWSPKPTAGGCWARTC
jgi:pyruvate/2-oxoglutarate dehydrogenase complex dihydrolipoamide dehydrogenase (E3) component